MGSNKTDLPQTTDSVLVEETAALKGELSDIILHIARPQISWNFSAELATLVYIVFNKPFAVF